jgi:hypothetical protein
MSDRTTGQQRETTANSSDGTERDPKLPFTELPRRPIKAGRSVRSLDLKLTDNELPRRPIKAGRGCSEPAEAALNPG